jgi:hypothetical protein
VQGRGRQARAAVEAVVLANGFTIPSVNFHLLGDHAYPG